VRDGVKINISLSREFKSRRTRLWRLTCLVGPFHIQLISGNHDSCDHFQSIREELHLRNPGRSFVGEKEDFYGIHLFLQPVWSRRSTFPIAIVRKNSLITGNSVLLGTVKFDRSADTLKKASAI
jgi:hypothetical protein